MFVDSFLLFQFHFHQSGPFKLIATMLKSLYVLLGLSPVWNRYPKGVTRKGLPNDDIIKDIVCKNKWLSAIWLLRRFQLL